MPTKPLRLEVDARQYRFVLKLLQSLPFVQVSEPELTAEQAANYQNVQQGLKKLTLLREGKLPAKPIQQLLDGLPD